VYYRRPDGTPIKEAKNFRDALRPLKRFYGGLPAAQFGPVALRAVREEMVRRGWCRTHVNRQVNRLRHVFKWAAGRELVSASVYHALQAVEGLKAGRSEARESAAVAPVDEAHALAAAELMSPPVKAMVELQLLTGVLQPLLKPDMQEFIFSPADAVEAMRVKRRAARKTPQSCGNRPGTNVRRRPRRKPGLRYTVESYAHAIYHACDKAFPPPEPLARRKGETRADWKARLCADERKALGAWRKAHRFHPHQLRHTAATRIRKQFTLDAAQVILGHNQVAATQVYAEKNVEAARRVMAAVG
jgi:integrase